MADGDKLETPCLWELQALLKYPRLSMLATLQKRGFVARMTQLYTPSVSKSENPTFAQRQEGGAVIDFLDELLSVADNILASQPSKKAQSQLKQAARKVFAAIISVVNAELSHTSTQTKQRNALEDSVLAIDGIFQFDTSKSLVRKIFGQATKNARSFIETVVANLCKNFESAFLSVRAVEILSKLHVDGRVATEVDAAVVEAVPPQHTAQLTQLFDCNRSNFLENAIKFAADSAEQIAVAATSNSLPVVLGNRERNLRLESKRTTVGAQHLSLVFGATAAQPLISIPLSNVHRPKFDSSRGVITFSTNVVAVLDAVGAPREVTEVDVSLDVSSTSQPMSHAFATTLGVTASAPKKAKKINDAPTSKNARVKQPAHKTKTLAKKSTARVKQPPVHKTQTLAAKTSAKVSKSAQRGSSSSQKKIANTKKGPTANAKPEIALEVVPSPLSSGSPPSPVLRMLTPPEQQQDKGSGLHKVFIAVCRVTFAGDRAHVTCYVQTIY